MKKDKIYETVEKYLPELLETLGKVVQCESPSHEDKVISNKCGEYLEELFGSLGFRIERIHQEKCGDGLYGELGHGEKKALIVGHYDTVFPIGTLNNMPWRIEGDKAYGPGVLDMKGGIIMAYYGIKVLQELDAMPEGTIGIFLDADEESGSYYSSDKIIDIAKEYSSALIMEPGVEELGSIKMMRFGRGTYKVTIHGKAAHSGSNPKSAISPFLELANQLYAMDEWGKREKNATFAPTVIKGGIDGTCVIPEAASFTMDVRYRTKEAMKRVHEEIMTLKPVDDRYAITVEGLIDKPIMIGDERLFQKLEEIAPDYNIPLTTVICSGGSDGNFTAGVANVPTIDGLGMTGEFLHTPNEYIIISHIVQRTAMFARLLQVI